MSESEEVMGTINITVTNSNVEYDTNFEYEQVIFWIEVLKTMMFKKMLDNVE